MELGRKQAHLGQVNDSGNRESQGPQARVGEKSLRGSEKWEGTKPTRMEVEARLLYEERLAGVWAL